MTTEEKRGCVPIFVQIRDGELIEIGTISPDEEGRLNPYNLAAFFRAAADEIEASFENALKDLVDATTYERWKEEEARHHDGQAGP